MALYRGLKGFEYLALPFLMEDPTVGQKEVRLVDWLVDWLVGWLVGWTAVQMVSHEVLMEALLGELLVDLRGWRVDRWEFLMVDQMEDH